MMRGSKGPYPYYEGHHLIVATQQFVYADESGTHDASVYCIVAGYRASPRQWKKFSDQWSAVLHQYRVAEFHSNVFFSRAVITKPAKNPYLRWPEKKAAAFLNSLVDAIAERQLHPVGCAVDVPAFNRLSYGERCALTHHEVPGPDQKRRLPKPSPYFFAFSTMLGEALDGTHPDTDVHFTFDFQRDYKGRATDIFRLTREFGKVGVEHQLKSIKFESAVDWPGLQAADLYAHQWYNTSVHRKPLNEENHRVMMALTRRRSHMLVANAISLEQILDSAATPEQRAFLKTVHGPEA